MRGSDELLSDDSDFLELPMIFKRKSIVSFDLLASSEFN